MCIQGVQQHQIPAHPNNDLRSTTGAVSQSSYVSSSGIKSVLLNAWNTVKSAVSGMLSSFGLHLSGEQGSDKPGREIVMDISSRPLPPTPLSGMDAQLESNIYESSNGNICNSVDVAKSEYPGRKIMIGMSCRPLPLTPLQGMDEQFDKRIYASNNNEDTYSEIEDYYSEIEDYYSEIEGDYSEVESGNSETEDTYSEVDENESSEVDVLENNIYEGPDVYRKGNGETETAEADDSAKHTYEDPEADDPAKHIYEDPDVYRDADNVINSGNMVLVCDDTYAEPPDNLSAGGRAEQEGIDSKYESLHENNYAVPYKLGNMVSIPDNDRKQSLPDAQLQQRIMRERLNIS
ncbi:TPA: hypothetical protein ACNVU4_001426 [Morganella morganii]